MLLRCVALLTVIGAVACEAPPVVDDVLDQRINLADVTPPTNGVLLSGPEIVIEAGKDVMQCWVPDYTPDRDFLVKHAKGYQGASGHHVIIMSSGIPRPPGDQFDCTSGEAMASLRPLIIPSLETAATVANGVNEVRILPEGMAVRMPAGTQIVVQSHYVNVNVQPIKIADVMTLEFTDEGEEVTEASYFVQNEIDLDIAEGVNTVTQTCEVDARTQIVLLLGHMHEWGKAFKLEHQRADVTSLLYEVPVWTAEYRDAAPVATYDPAEPLVLEAGDRLRISCTYDNDTGDNLRFPNEMCTVFTTYFPATEEGFTICRPIGP